MVWTKFPYTYPGLTPTTSGQQTFLGASIVNFTQSLGYDNDTSTLNVELAVDSANRADQTPHDQGQDIYHGLTGDVFRPRSFRLSITSRYPPSFGYHILKHALAEISSLCR